ncbi:MAG: type 4a pilus biogenesis protein PilO [Candidatus Pacebacteria bacterium]|nr:type 4a pilus biogenesis protein PilO [Candidatus Paceibacterota bacterium]
MTETSKQNLAILFITLMLAATIFLFARFLQPAINQAKELSAKIKEEQEKIRLLQDYKTKSELLVQTYANLGEQVNDVHLALPDDPQAAQVLAILDAISKKTNIYFSNLTFTEGSQEGQNYLEIKTVFFANYEDFKKWIAEIEKELRLIDLTRISIKQSDSPKSTVMEYDLVMRVYFIGSDTQI